MPTSNGGHHGSNGHGHGHGGPLPPDGMYHVSDSINGINDGIGEKVNSDERSLEEGDGGRNSGSGSSDETAAAGVGLYRRLPSSTCV